LPARRAPEGLIEGLNGYKAGKVLQEVDLSGLSR